MESFDTSLHEKYPLNPDQIKKVVQKEKTEEILHATDAGAV
jgi:hypothetical protein